MKRADGKEGVKKFCEKVIQERGEISAKELLKLVKQKYVRYANKNERWLGFIVAELVREGRVKRYRGKDGTIYSVRARRTNFPKCRVCGEPARHYQERCAAINAWKS